MYNTNKFETTAENEDNNKLFNLIKDLGPFENNTLDIGACIGNFTKFLATQTKKNVYAFEPSPDNYQRLLRDTAELDNVLVYNLAISDSDGYSTLHLCPNDIGMNRLYHSKWCENGDIIRVETRSIDSIIRTYHKIDFVKIDVEGYEPYVLRGMRQLLKRDHPTIMMEFHPPSIEEAIANPEYIWDLLISKMDYNHPMNCETGEFINSYEELDKQTRNSPAVNLLFII